MKFLDPKQWSKKTTLMGVPIPKGVLYFLGAIVVATILLWVTGYALRSGLYGAKVDYMNSGGGTSMGYPGRYASNMGVTESSVAPGMPPMAGGYGGGEAAYDMGYAQKGGVAISYPYPYPMPSSTTGPDAEKFEVTEYIAAIKVQESDPACDAIAALKADPDIIFESAHAHTYGCEYRFKTTKGEVERVLALLESYNPDELRTATETVEPRVDNYTDEEEILNKKLASIDATLESAEEAYDEIARVAANAKDADALAQIIQSKIALIERMTQERLMIRETLDRLAKGKTNELDRLNYTFFNVSVYEQKIVDPKNIGDTWNAALRQFVSEANTLLIGLLLGFIIHLLIGLQLALYLFIILVVVKYGWRWVREFWKS